MSKIKIVIIALVCAALITAAVFGYNYLKDNYNPESAPQTTAQSDNTTAGNNSAFDLTVASAVGTAADFTVTDKDGSKFRLSDFSGKPVVINFWATWCSPCKSELPAFNAAYEQYGADIEFMMVNLTDGIRETVAKVSEFTEENNYNFPVYFDTDYSGSEAYNVSSIPLTVFIDKNGNVFDSHLGAMNDATLTGYLENLLK